MIRAVTIDKYWTNLYFQLDIYNPLFENIAPDIVFDISGLRSTHTLPILSLQNNKIRSFDWLVL